MMASFSSAGQTKPSMEKMQWLVGSWKGMAGGAPFYEAWRKAGSNELRQYGVKISGADTTVSEIGKIVIKEGKAVFGDEQHSWNLNTLTASEMTFVNPQIRFPDTILWRRMENGHWYCLLKNNDQKIEYDIEPLPALNKVVDRWIKTKEKS